MLDGSIEAQGCRFLLCTKGCEGLHTMIMHWISLVPRPEEEENGPGNEASTGSEHMGGGLTETEQPDRNHSCLCRSTPSEHLAEKKIIKSVVQLLMYTIFPLFVFILSYVPLQAVAPSTPKVTVVGNLSTFVT